ncbi:hypothetical protein IKE67_04380, partial [bacterium]|nr:hypothetical protein [bacterium]
MNFGEYLKKITGIESNQIQGEHPTKSDLSHIEADYTESSLFTSQQDSEAGDVDNIFGVMRSDEIEQLDFNKILKQPKSDDKDDADNADEENLSGRELALREFFNIDAVKEAADTDGNGEVSAEEAAAYLNGIIDKDGNSEELSIEDFNKIIEELGVVFTPMVDENGEPVLDDNGEMIPEPVSSVETAIAAQSPSAPTRSYGGNYHPSRPGEKIPTLAEMEEEKTRLESVVSEKQAAVDAVNNGQNEKVKEAQAKADEAKAARDEAISKDDIPSRYKKSLNETEEEIAANKASLDQNAINISHLQSDIENKEHAISSMNTSLSGLETSLSSLPQPTGAEADREKDAEIAQKKTSIENQIKDKKAEIEEENKKLEELKANLEKLNNEKAE